MPKQEVGEWRRKNIKLMRLKRVGRCQLPFFSLYACNTTDTNKSFQTRQTLRLSQLTDTNECFTNDKHAQDLTHCHTQDEKDGQPGWGHTIHYDRMLVSQIFLLVMPYLFLRLPMTEEANDTKDEEDIEDDPNHVETQLNLSIPAVDALCFMMKQTMRPLNERREERK